MIYTSKKQIASRLGFTLHDPDASRQNNKPAVQCRENDQRQDLETIESLALDDVHFSYPARPEAHRA